MSRRYWRQKASERAQTQTRMWAWLPSRVPFEPDCSVQVTEDFGKYPLAVKFQHANMERLRTRRITNAPYPADQSRIHDCADPCRARSAQHSRADPCRRAQPVLVHDRRLGRSDSGRLLERRLNLQRSDNLP